MAVWSCRDPVALFGNRFIRAVCPAAGLNHRQRQGFEVSRSID